jgi:hypothetical protein
MPIETNDHETRMILGLFRPKAIRKGNAVSRLVRAGHPYVVGDRVALGASFQGKMVLYAGGIIRGMLEHTFTERACPSPRMDDLAKAEGYESASAWAQSMRRRYPEVRSESNVLRLSLDQIRLSPEISGQANTVSPDEPVEMDEVDLAPDGGSKPVMSATSLDAFAELGGGGPL